MIVDASVAFKWIFVEDGSDAAIALIGETALNAPTLLHIELGNALWKKRSLGQLGDPGVFAAKLALAVGLVTSVDETPFIGRALEMALRLDHAIYDCVYLALAEGLAEPLVTADRRFADKVASSGFGGIVEVIG